MKLVINRLIYKTPIIQILKFNKMMKNKKKQKMKAR